MCKTIIDHDVEISIIYTYNFSEEMGHIMRVKCSTSITGIHTEHKFSEFDTHNFEILGLTNRFWLCEQKIYCVE